jgi:hypothetical protein
LKEGLESLRNLIELQTKINQTPPDEILFVDEAAKFLGLQKAILIRDGFKKTGSFSEDFQKIVFLEAGSS